MPTDTTATVPKSIQSIFHWVGNHWFETFLIVYGLWVFTPFLAPFFMYMGWTGAGKAIYFTYSFFCHQLPERSFFLFGEKTMYSLSEVQAVWQNTINPMILRQFIGNESMGWKIAWSDRMISFYTSVWVFAALWFPFRHKIKTLSWIGFILLLLPLIMDGGTHMLSDFAGIGQGFRDTNQWLVIFTNNSFHATFYAGDALGSFNSFMRFLTGFLAGLGIVWLAFPYIFQTQALDQELDKLSYAKVIEQIKDKIRILLADDHHIVRAGVRQLLESASDLQVIAEAGDGEEAQALIQKHKPDVAVLDIQMPKASGIEVTRWVRAHLPEVGVLILTAYDDDPYVMAVLQAGANGYVLKTANTDDLIQAVRDVNEGKSALDPAITRKLMSNLFKGPDKKIVEPLTDRELDVLRLAAKGFTNKAIGVQLSISDRTVQGHLAHIFAKLQANSRTEAVMRAVSLGLISQGSGNVAEE